MQYHASSACYNTPRVPEYDTPSARATQVVMGEILSTEQQLTETQRGLERLPRQRDSKDKNLQDQLQALGVQVQDAENEMVAAELKRVRDTGALSILGHNVLALIMIEGDPGVPRYVAAKVPRMVVS